MASLPLDANVPFMTVMATKMPFIGRGLAGVKKAGAKGKCATVPSVIFIQGLSVPADCSQTAPSGGGQPPSDMSACRGRHSWRARAGDRASRCAPRRARRQAERASIAAVNRVPPSPSPESREQAEIDDFDVLSLRSSSKYPGCAADIGHPGFELPASTYQPARGSHASRSFHGHACRPRRTGSGSARASAPPRVRWCGMGRAVRARSGGMGSSGDLEIGSRDDLGGHGRGPAAPVARRKREPCLKLDC